MVLSNDRQIREEFRTRRTDRSGAAVLGLPIRRVGLTRIPVFGGDVVPVHTFALPPTRRTHVPQPISTGPRRGCNSMMTPRQLGGRSRLRPLRYCWSVIHTGRRDQRNGSGPQVCRPGIARAARAPMVRRGRGCNVTMTTFVPFALAR
jgi:hypothetical protein